MSAIQNKPDDESNTEKTEAIYEEHREAIHEISEDESVSDTMRALAKATIDIAGGGDDDAGE